MAIFSQFIRLLAQLPDWLSLFLSPVLVTAALPFLVWRKKHKLYPPIALCLGIVGAVLVGAEGGIVPSLVWTGLYALYCRLLGSVLYFFRRQRGKKVSREDALYERFRLPLENAPIKEEVRIPKVTCYSDQTVCDAEESGVQLSHVLELLERLQGYSLSASDRLETDMLARRMDGFRNKKLSGDELNSLNDCLATVLRLTAKYAL